MPEDAIVGATYEDRVYDDTFTIVEVSSESESADEDEIDVAMEYERLGEITVTLEQFRAQDDIDLLGVPAHAQ